jgi:hypothetical protein
LLKLQKIADLTKAELKDKYGLEGSDAMEDFMKDMQKSKVGGYVDPWAVSPMGHEIYETLRQVSLAEILGGGTGSDFMSYLIPTKIYQVLLDAYRDEDISADIVGWNEKSFAGGTLNVVWGVVDKMKAVWYKEPGGPPIVTEEVNRTSLTPKPFGMDCAITKSMIEDSEFGIMEYHIRHAGKQMGAFLTAHVLSQMFSGYDSGNNAVAGGTDVITVAQVVSAINKVNAQGGKADTIVLCSDQQADVMADTTTYNLALQWKERQTEKFQIDGTFGLRWYPRRIATDNGLYSTSDTDYYALVFERARGAALAWKRPLTIENYTAPREGIAGAVVSARAAAAAVHDGDFISAILET